MVKESALESVEASGYKLGKEVLGPALACFTWLLLSAAKRDKVTRLVFVSRDGELLLRAAELFCKVLPWEPPELDYIHLSRVSTALACEPEFGVQSLCTASRVRAGKATVASLLAFFGLDASQAIEHLADHGLSPATPIDDVRRLGPFLSHPGVKEWIAGHRQDCTKLLAAYLERHKVLGNPSCALVDIGWQGSIPGNLEKAFPGDAGCAKTRTYYFCYWSEAGLPTQAPNVVGLISDIRRARNLLEAAPRHVAFLLESICRAPEGTVIGYHEDMCGEIAPVLAIETPQRLSELSGEKRRTPIRRGILDFIQMYGEDYFQGSANEAQRRREIQKGLWRLAFFPSIGELAVAAGLTHTEGHRAEWSRSLIDADLPNPLLSPRRWLHGLSSPWRSGYIAASGGIVFSIAYVLFESMLTIFPESIRRAVENIARRWGRVPS